MDRDVAAGWTGSLFETEVSVHFQKENPAFLYSPEETSARKAKVLSVLAQHSTLKHCLWLSFFSVGFTIHMGANNPGYGACRTIHPLTNLQQQFFKSINKNNRLSTSLNTVYYIYIYPPSHMKLSTQHTMTHQISFHIHTTTKNPCHR